MSQRAIAYLREHGQVEQQGRAIRIGTEQLERSFYESVNEVLTRLGGKWNGRKKLHLYPYDVTAAFEAVLRTGEMPPKNPTALFPTPQALVDELVALSGVTEAYRVLEPSAGLGAIADAARATGARVDCCEVLPLCRSVLEEKGHHLVADDFLAYDPGPIYDAVLMNPPFSLEGDKLAYITHIYHAWTLLKEGGVLVAIVPPFEYQDSKRHEEFRFWVSSYGEWTENGAGAFKESGTDINTHMVYARKEGQGWRREPFQGWATWHAWNLCLWMANTYEWYEKAYALGERGDLAGFQELAAHVTKEARKCQEPLDPTPDDIAEVFETFRPEHYESQPEPKPEAAPLADFGPLFGGLI